MSVPTAVEQVSGPASATVHRAKGTKGTPARSGIALEMEEHMRLLIASLAMSAAPAMAASPVYRPEPAVLEDHNSYWLDYKTDVSEAKRELRKDLKRAKKPSDRREAWAEYHQELADARRDFRKEMREKGYVVGEVTVTE
jgi:hypothetical protein